MQLTEQQLRDKADINFTDTIPGAIDAARWSDFFTDDVSDSLVPKDESGKYYRCLIGNWSEDFALLNHTVPIYKLTALSVTIPHTLGFSDLIILVFDEDNILRDDSFFFWTVTDSNNIVLSFYRMPNYGKFFKVIIQAV